jgi:TolB protein
MRSAGLPFSSVLPLLSLFMVLGSLAAALPAQAQAPLIRIEGAEFRPLPIAVPAFKTADGVADKVSSKITTTLRNDLDLSGVFKILDPKSFIADAKKEGILLSTIKFDDWVNVGADALVKAEIRPDGGNFKIQVHVFEVAAQREAFKKSYSSTEAGLRDAAHKIADDIFRHFTGEPGVFSTQIVVVRKIAAEKQLYIMDMDGENARQLTRGAGLNLLPSFAPKGGAVLFTSYRYDNPDLFEIGVGGGEMKRLSSRPGLNTGAVVSPDGGRIALTLSKDGNSEIYVLARNGKGAKRLTNSWGIDTSPSWSPDGKQIAFVSSRSGNPHIYVMNADGSGQRRLTFQGTYNQTPRWSPRGTHIAFTARDEFNRFDIFLLEVKTGTITRLTQDQGNNEDPWFAPNGRLIVFTSNRTQSRQLFIMNLDGSHQRQITAGGAHWTPAWGPFKK